jgi:catechol 2,3-dioxygenase-like lactoylglutathione lyase family enzyme
MRVKSLDQLALTVRDIEASCSFYTRALGMQLVTFGNGRKALSFGVQKINLRPYRNEFEPKADQPTPGSADLCFLIDVPFEKVVDHLKHQNVAIVEGPVAKTGAIGSIRSIYCRDPDGNLIEVATYLAG